MKTPQFLIKTRLVCLAAGALLTSASLAQTAFTKVTDGPIVNDQGNFTIGAWGDLNNRGLLDLFVCNYGTNNVLYTNNGNGTFTKVLQGDPVQDQGAHVCPAIADFDNDGYPDLLISEGVDAPAPQPNRLYHNNGKGTFIAVSGGGVTNIVGFFNACAVVDYDNDGFVDLFVTQADPNGIGRTSLLFHNNGDGTFSRVTNRVATDPVDAASAAWADYDGDGLMDLIVTSVGTPSITASYLYHNNGHGQFSRILTNAVATDYWPDGPWGAAWGDYDNDGLLDLFVTGMEMGNRLYHNNGNGMFTNVTSGPMLQAPPGGGFRACAWGDYDNDGYLDLFVSGNATNRLFHSNGDGTFTQILSGDPVVDPASDSLCCGWADYDNDGFLDLFMTRTGTTGNSNVLYHNNGNTNGWLKVKLVGTVSNRSAIGAKVRVRATIRGRTFWQLREISSGGARWIQPLVSHFGLGDATNVDTVRIEWPFGTVQELHNVTPRQFLTVTEPPRLLATMTNGVPQFVLRAWPGTQFDIQSSSDLAAWSAVSSVTVTNPNGSTEIIDANPASSDRRFYRAVTH